MASTRPIFAILLMFCLLSGHSGFRPCTATAAAPDEPSLVKNYMPSAVHARKRPKLPKSGKSKSKDEPQDENATPTPVVENDGTCFPSTALVRLQNGVQIPMAKLTLGDKVQVSLSGEFSPVFMFTHKLDSGIYNFVSLTTKGGNTITLTPSHYIYANDQLVPAGEVRLGDKLLVTESHSLPDSGVVTSVRMVRERGLFNPQTLHGDIVVDGIRVSTYTLAVQPAVAHYIALAPFRLLWTWTGVDFSAGLLHGNLFSKAVALLSSVARVVMSWK